MIKVDPFKITSAYDNTEIDLDAFFIDALLVSNQDYFRFVQETDELPPFSWSGNRPPAHLLDHPVVEISLEQAQRYAAWCHKRIPTCLEWQAAARAPDGRAFPWGERWDPERCHGPAQNIRGTTSIRNHPEGASPLGCLGMVGNVWEWTLADPRQPPSDQDSSWVFGGSYRHPCVTNNAIARTTVRSSNSYLYLGFRCALTL